MPDVMAKRKLTLNSRRLLSACILLIVGLQFWHSFRFSILSLDRPENAWLAPTKALRNKDFGPMLDLLTLAGATVDDEVKRTLPDWSTVKKVIGAEKPVIWGLEHCPTLNKDETILSVAGMFHSHTNGLFQLLKMNCEIGSKKYKDKWGMPMSRVRWQTPWGKHERAESRENMNATSKHSNPSYLDSNWDLETILPVVTIRDPYMWMQSMCQRNFNSDWFFTDAHCPNLVPSIVDSEIYGRMKKRNFEDFNRRSDKIHVIGGTRDDTGFDLKSKSTPVQMYYRWGTMKYDSLAHFWNEWYQGYNTAGLPRLLIRAEDLVFFPKEVTTQICECAGGTMTDKFALIEDDLSNNEEDVDSLHDMTNIMIRYGSSNKRTHQMTKDDFAYAKKHLDYALMKMMNYTHPKKLEVKPPHEPPQWQVSEKKVVLPKIKSKSHQPLIDILEMVEEQVDEETLKMLPSWDKVTTVIGSTKPIIQGLEQCPSFNKNETILAAAGMFNTGTNNLFHLLIRNCRVESSMYLNKYNKPQTRLRWQTPWGKHEVTVKRNLIHSNTTRLNQAYLDDNWDHENILPVVTIRDPYTWMQSMCRRRYAAEWFHTNVHCPNLIPSPIDRQMYKRTKKRKFKRDPNLPSDKVKVMGGHKDDTGFHPSSDHVPVKVKYNAFNTSYESLAHLWSEWYQGYLDSKAPFLLVRAEDLIFFPEQVVREVCHCVGGKMAGTFSLVKEDLKLKGNHGVVRISGDMSSLLVRYGSGRGRTNQMTEADLEFAKKHLNSSLMNMNAYRHPEKLELDETEATEVLPKPTSSQTFLKSLNSFINSQNSKAATVVSVTRSMIGDPLADILSLAGQNLTTKSRQRLPSWSTITATIGSKEPIIHGLDHCSSFDAEETILAVGGMFKSESNLLFSLLQINCETESTHRGSSRVRMGFPWGMHGPADLRGKSSNHYKDKDWRLDHILPVVSIPDPYTWMQAMCVFARMNPSSLSFFSTDHHCPNLVPTKSDNEVYERMKSRTFIKNPNKHDDSIKVLSGALDDAGYNSRGDHVPIKVSYGDHSVIYDSMVHAWNKWYATAWNAEFPKLFVRAEDVIFFPQEVTKKVCECAGGKMKENFSFAAINTMNNEDTDQDIPAYIKSLIITYGSGKRRTHQMTEDDLKYAQQHLDESLMSSFGYSHPKELEVSSPPTPFKVLLREASRRNISSKSAMPRLTVSTVDKEPLIDLLRDAGEPCTDTDVERLPTWSQVTSLIGDSPKIYGLEKCSSFDKSEAILAVAGILNSGTNFLYSLLNQNCDIFSSSFADPSGYATKRVRWQVYWGKHEIPSLRASRDVYPDNLYDVADIIPVVTIRDPYSWMQSMCREPYVASWYYTDKHCPNLVPTQEDIATLKKYQSWRSRHSMKSRLQLTRKFYNTTNRFAPGEARMVGGFHTNYTPPPFERDTVPVSLYYKSGNITFTSIADVWNAFYREYAAYDHPALFLRVEDLVFFPKNVTKAVCECAGGKIHDINNFNYVTKALKKSTEATGYSMVDLMVRYGSAQKRTTQMTQSDLARAMEVLDTDLMDLYGYKHPDWNQ